jgi:ketosteroid isomerase-like protein
MPEALLAEILSERYDAWWAALPMHDRATLEEILAPDWVYIDQFGAVRNREEYINLVEAAIRSDHSTITVDLDASLLDTTAIATGRYDVKGVIAGNDIDIRLRYTSIWRSESGSWRCHWQHTTEIREAQW